MIHLSQQTTPEQKMASYVYFEDETVDIDWAVTTIEYGVTIYGYNFAEIKALARRIALAGVPVKVFRKGYNFIIAAS